MNQGIIGRQHRSLFYLVGVSLSAFLLAGLLVAVGGVPLSSASPRGNSTRAAAFYATAEKIAAKATGKQAPDPPRSGPSAVSGKSLTLVPCASNDLACETEVTEVRQVAETLGWTSTIINPAGTPSKEAAAVQEATTNGSSGIFTVAVTASTIPAALSSAKSDHLFSGCFACINHAGLYNFILPTQTAYVNSGYELAAKAYVNTHGHLRAIVISDDEFEVAVLRNDGIMKFINACTKAGGDCKVLAKPSILIAKISTTVPPEIVSVARSNPTWNALFTPYDGAFVYIIPALARAGVKKTQKAYGFDPVQQDMEWIRTGHIEAAAVASPYKTIAYAAVDDLNRLFQGKPVVTQHIKLKLIDPQNVRAAGTLYQGTGNAAPAYLKIWKKKG
jgi:ribose transport system substrate-binding protein